MTSAEDCEQVPPPIGPYTAGPASARIRRLSPDGGRDAVIAAGIPSSQTSARSGGMVSGVAAIAFDVSGRLYALETTTVDNSGPAPGSGRVVRVLPGSETPEAVASGLTFPTAMTFGPDGMLYVSNFGYGFPPGSVQIVRVEVPDPL